MTIQITEKSLELALVKAAGKLGATQTEIKYKLISEKQGFLGFGRKVTIEAWKKHPRSQRRQAKTQHSRRSNASAPLSSEADLKGLQQELTQHFEGLASKLSSHPVQAKVSLNNDRLHLDAQSEELAQQIRKNSKLAEAIEHLLRKMPRKVKQELPFRIFVDSLGVRKEREQELINMAQAKSREVYETGRSVVLNYRSSYDRKIIHMALDGNTQVFTKSIGSGSNRKLMILPQKES